jgi:repressor LexA
MLTQRQQEILDYLEATHREQGYLPSTREIQTRFGFASQTAAVNHLRALERKGVLKRLARKARAIQLRPAPEPRDLVQIPIRGVIPAGSAVDAAEDQMGYLTLDASIAGARRGAQLFALRVNGDSMIDAGIYEGDLVILEKREPKEGDVVAALIDGESTLKRFVMRNQQPFLRAENPKYSDLVPARELVIQGVVTALIRTVSRSVPQR